jgi:pantothenate kinase type III
MSMRLLADCGNSTIKLALAHEGGIWLSERLEPHEGALDAFLAPHAQAVSEVAVVPGARATTAILTTWWSRVGAGRPLRILGEAALPVPDLGQYPGCGADRVMAGLVAGQQERKSLVVIDAGTATTLSAWIYHPEAADALDSVRFGGGLILPGARTLVLALAAQAPSLPAVEPLGPSAHARQFSTSGAISAAIGIGYGPMVAACLLKLERETGIHAWLATGGNCGLLIDSLIVPRLSYRPSLVLEGLEMVCRHQDRVGTPPASTAG